MSHQDHEHDDDGQCETCHMRAQGGPARLGGPSPSPEAVNAIFRPRSVAVVGASANPSKVGHAVLKNVITSGFEGEVYPINLRASEILGVPAFPNVAAVPGEIDVAIICIPARFVLATMEELGQKGVKGAVVITAGFREIGGSGVELEHQLVEVARRHNIRLVGPNCLGVISRAYNASFSSRHPPKGNVAMISQSGAMMTAILDWSLTNNLGFSNFISIGNKCDLDEVDLIEACGADPDTHLVLVYIESVTDGNKFLRVLPKVTAQKPVIILKSGVSEAGRRAASSHTGALAQSDIMFDASFARAGVIRAHRMQDLFDLARGFVAVTAPPTGRKFAIVTNAGGPGIVTTDACVKQQVDLAVIPDDVQKLLYDNLPAEAACGNPIDIIGDATPTRYRDTIDTLFSSMSDEDLAGALVLVTPQSQTDPDGVAELLLEMKAKYPSKTLLASFMGGPTMDGPKVRLSEGPGVRVPVYDFPEGAVSAARAISQYFEQRSSPRSPSPSLVTLSDAKRAVIQSHFATARRQGRKVLYSYETSDIFEHCGITAPITRLLRVETEEVGEDEKNFSWEMADLEEACEDVSFPLVLKIVSPDILHKSDCGGVILSIESLEHAAESVATMLTSVKEYYDGNPPLIYGIEVQQMVNMKRGHEVIVGVSRDPTFGALLMVGKGGKYANYVKDVAFDLIDESYSLEDAEVQFARTNISTILEGVRGEAPGARDQLYGCMKKVAELVSTFDEIMELDVNPLLVFPEGINAIDIKITFDPDVCFGSL